MKDPDTYYGGRTKVKGTNRFQFWVTKGRRLLLLVEVKNSELRVLRGSSARFFKLVQPYEVRVGMSDDSIREDAEEKQAILLAKAVLHDAYGVVMANRCGQWLGRHIQNEGGVQDWVCSLSELFLHTIECEKNTQEMLKVFEFDEKLMAQAPAPRSILFFDAYAAACANGEPGV